ncbi:transcriptional regulator [Brevirhabdus pacifica]|uniref:Transcriptional regulator n=1 Tax=Brevirhabdus pacifica TaxID=1267768 RepID=A0A1U7DLP9_9RHOB|nr:helix-turn-helix domain-containing protein [Brevirhabdus pacifica]APX90809.1 transcriptional regulator [Brevirhabdus pacifica]OWU79592.1 transcriptional regulator [Loktanella sp. 22II-4b]PJJ87304.1 CRP/FNR family transcriptional regulator [Brevirhabdus pacifica]
MVAQTRTSACSECPIRHRAVCAECGTDDLAVLEMAKSYKTYPAGTRLASEGQPLMHFSSFVAGAATMSRMLEDGRRQTVGLLMASDFIGRPGRAVSAYDVEALSEVTLCRFERRTFETLVKRTPAIAARMLTMTLDELDAARELAVILGRMTAREKVAAFLVSMVRRLALIDGAEVPTDEVTFKLPLSRDQIADHLGLTIETTSRQFTALRKEGLIDLPGGRSVRIPDFQRLTLETGEDDDGGPLD